MTEFYFVRHAQPDYRSGNNATFGLSDEGILDRMTAADALKDIHFDAVISSPYRRSMETILPVVEKQGLSIITDARLRERDSGINGNSNFDLFKKRWSDFSYHEDGGESLSECQDRNIEVLNELIEKYKDRSLLIGTHGTSLSTIINYFEPTFGFESFMRIVDYMPYVICMKFEGNKYMGFTELAYVHKAIHGKK